MRNFTFPGLLIHAFLLCCVRSAWAFHTIPCSNATIQDAIDSILAEERNNGGADGVDYYIALGGGLTFNEPVVINDNGTPGGVAIAIVGGLATDPGDPNGCAASPGVFDGSETVMSGGGRFHQSVIQITGNATVYLDRLTLSGASLGGSGGGISFDGAGLLGLYGVNIANNAAGSGAGIHAGGNDPGLGIEFHDLVTPEGRRFTNVIQGNTATSGPGGAVDLSGNAYLVANDGTLVIIQNTASGNGGGIAMRGYGRVELGQNVQIVGNSAANGGGIYAAPSSPASVKLRDGVLIGGNRVANDGGGLYVANATDLQVAAASQPPQIIANQSSSASGRGGGIYFSSPSDGTFSGSITDNQAGYGGGIFMTCVGGDSASLRLNSSVGIAPVSVSRNYATRQGGGIYAKTTNGSGFPCDLHASNFTMEGNAAPDGSAIFGDSSGQPFKFWFNGGDACRTQANCNTISGNFLANGATAGSTIALTNRIDMLLVSTKIQRNTGMHVVRAPDSESRVTVQTALITGNTTGSQLIDTDSAILDIADATVADNSILDGSTIFRAKNVYFYNSIVSEQEVDTFDFAGNASGGHNIGDVLTNPLDGTMSNADGRVLHGHPTFVDAANGNYHLAPYSLGIDVGVANPQAPVDLDQNVRDVDQDQIQNLDGPRDLGAYEIVADFPACSSPDTIFCTQFE